MARNSPFKVSKWSIRGLSPDLRIHYAMFIPIELSSWGRKKIETNEITMTENRK